MNIVVKMRAEPPIITKITETGLDNQRPSEKKYPIQMPKMNSSSIHFVF
jgi:hypothetical protein